MRGTGGSFHPFFAYHGRIVNAGAMLATAAVYAVTKVNPTVPMWDPLNDSAKATPVAPGTRTLIYTGPCRVIMNQDWRARKSMWQAESPVDQATSVMLSYDGNTLPGFERVMPDIPVGSEVRITSVTELGGVPMDKSIMDYIYTVRIIGSNSNSWVRDLLCDIMPNNMVS